MKRARSLALSAAIGLGLLVASQALIPREPAHVYTVFLPMVRTPFRMGMGLAWAHYGVESKATLNADWCYTSGGGQDGCIPQNPFGDWQFPCPAIELFLNEPDGWEGAGAPQLVAPAVAKSKAERQRCPGTLLIAGNVIDGDYYGWLAEYVRQGGEADVLASHCYAGTAQRCIDLLSAFKERFVGWQMCLTEWNITGSTPPGYNQVEEFRKMLAWVQANFTCSAVYTDWAPPEYAWASSTWLLNADRTPNERGIIYRDR